MVRRVDVGKDKCGWNHNHNRSMEVAALAQRYLTGDASKGRYRGSAVQLAPQSQSSVELFRLGWKSTANSVFYDSSVNVSSASTPWALFNAMTRRQFVFDQTA
jgi:hypothetical protein